jgi:hypothetical protein
LIGTAGRDTILQPNRTPRETIIQATGLGLVDTQVTDAGLKDLKEFKQLTYLDLTGTKVTEEGLKELRAALPKCKVR